MKIREVYKVGFYYFLVIGLIFYHQHIPPLPEKHSFEHYYHSFLKNNDLINKISSMTRNPASHKKKAADSQIKTKRQILLKKNVRLTSKSLQFEKQVKEKLLSMGRYQRDTTPLYDGMQGEYRSSLLHFYQKLFKQFVSSNHDRMTLCLFGDSLVSADVLPYYLRDHFQSEFGNGGMGFFCIRTPNYSYLNRFIRQKGSVWKLASYAHRDLKDHYLGINGYSFIGDKNDWSEYYSTKTGMFEFGRIHFLREPTGGNVQVTLEEKTFSFSTKGSQTKADFYDFANSQNAKKLRLSIVDRPSRIYGIEFYNHTGIAFNTFPMIGAEISKLLRIDRKLWIDQLKKIAPDLVVLMFWGTKSTYSILKEDYFSEWREVLSRVKQAAPQSSVIVIGPTGIPRYRKGELVVKPIIHKIIAAQKKLTEEFGYTFLDLYLLSGGKQALKKWFGDRTDLVSSDKIHFTKKGASIIGTETYQVLMSSFREFLISEGYLSDF